MIKLFKHNPTLQFVVIIVVMLFMWLGAFLEPPAMPDVAVGDFYDLLKRLLGGVPLVATVLAFLLVGVEGFLVNLVLYKCRMIPQNTLLPMFLYVVAMGWSPAVQTLTPLVLLNLLILLMMYLMMEQGELPILKPERLFEVSALFALCLLVSAYSWVLLPVIIGVFIQYKLYSWRDFVIGLLGFLAPLIICGLCYFFNDSLLEVLTAMWGMVCAVDFHLGDAPWIDIVQAAVWLVLVLAGLAFSGRLRTNKLVVDNINHTIMALLLATGLLGFMYVGLLPVDRQAIALSSAYLLSLLFLNIPRGRYWNLLFISFVLVSVGLPYLI